MVAETVNTPPYKTLVKRAIKDLDEQGGSSRQAIRTWVLANYTVNSSSFDTAIKNAIRKGCEDNTFEQSKQSFKLGKKEKKTSKAKSTAKKSIKKKKTTVKKSAKKSMSKSKPVKKTLSKKKSVPKKKAAAKKTTTKKRKASDSKTKSVAKKARK